MLTALAMTPPLEDLANRWHRARRAALGAMAREGTSDFQDGTRFDEALAGAPEEVTRRVFENSLKLGVGFSRYYERELALRELPNALTTLAVPCLTGAWTPIGGDGDGGLRLERKGCAHGCLGARACDYWREAIFGITLGLTGGVRLARHRSLGHGDESCVDVFYENPESSLRFGPIPEDMKEPLERVRRLVGMFDSRIHIDFVGLSERVLYYREIRMNGCSPETSVATLVSKTVRRHYPSLDTQEVSPRPVLAGDGG